MKENKQHNGNLVMLSVVLCCELLMLSVANKPFMLRVIMTSVALLSVIILSVIMLSVIMMSVIMLSAVMLIVSLC
jgi:hypothetical protein